MKKVGLCACYNTFNYGSMLQAFATQHIILEMGYECEFIVYKKKKNVMFFLKQIPRMLNYNLLYDKGMLYSKKILLLLHPDIKKKTDSRKEAFIKFQKKYYKYFSQEYCGYDDLKKAAYNYNSIVVGSDQLWTPGGLATNFYNLMFVPDSINKISYATSFGVNSIPFYQIKRTKKYLNRINYLSVRENKGAQIIQEITGRKAEVVLDPTLLISRMQWLEIIPEQKIINEPYIFCYFLGKNKEHRRIAEELKKKTGYKIVCTPFLDSFVKYDISFGDIQKYDIGPDEFVNLIRGAQYVLTDSFHGSVFSIINHKKFVVMNRFKNGGQSRNSRIDSLCNILGLETRRYKDNIYEQINEEIDYTIIDNKLAEVRKKSMHFLEKSLSTK